MVGEITLSVVHPVRSVATINMIAAKKYETLLI